MQLENKHNQEHVGDLGVGWNVDMKGRTTIRIEGNNDNWFENDVILCFAVTMKQSIW